MPRLYENDRNNTDFSTNMVLRIVIGLGIVAVALVVWLLVN